MSSINFFVGTARTSYDAQAGRIHADGMGQERTGDENAAPAPGTTTTPSTRAPGTAGAVTPPAIPTSRAGQQNDQYVPRRTGAAVAPYSLSTTLRAVRMNLIKSPSVAALTDAAHLSTLVGSFAQAEEYTRHLLDRIVVDHGIGSSFAGALADSSFQQSFLGLPLPVQQQVMTALCDRATIQYEQGLDKKFHATRQLLTNLSCGDANVQQRKEVRCAALTLLQTHRGDAPVELLAASAQCNGIPAGLEELSGAAEDYVVKLAYAHAMAAAGHPDEDVRLALDEALEEAASQAEGEGDGNHFVALYRHRIERAMAGNGFAESSGSTAHDASHERFWASPLGHRLRAEDVLLANPGQPVQVAAFKALKRTLVNEKDCVTGFLTLASLAVACGTAEDIRGADRDITAARERHAENEDLSVALAALCLAQVDHPHGRDLTAKALLLSRATEALKKCGNTAVHGELCAQVLLRKGDYKGAYQKALYLDTFNAAAEVVPGSRALLQARCAIVYSERCPQESRVAAAGVAAKAKKWAEAARSAGSTDPLATEADAHASMLLGRSEPQGAEGSDARKAHFEDAAVLLRELAGPSRVDFDRVTALTLCGLAECLIETNDIEEATRVLDSLAGHGAAIATRVKALLLRTRVKRQTQSSRAVHRMIRARGVGPAVDHDDLIRLFRQLKTMDDQTADVEALQIVCEAFVEKRQLVAALKYFSLAQAHLTGQDRRNVSDRIESIKLQLARRWGKTAGSSLARRAAGPTIIWAYDKMAASFREHPERYIAAGSVAAAVSIGLLAAFIFPPVGALELLLAGGVLWMKSRAPIRPEQRS